MLFSQLLLVMLGGPLLVQCQGTNDHAAIELAHANPCDDDGTNESLSDANATLAIADPHSATESYTTSDCVDTSLTKTTVLRLEDRSSLETLPILRTYQIAELPEIPAPALGESDAPVHVFSPDSPESLARNVILLI